ncbi:GNAT family N-acetyltransferase [Robiginitomaculum antarcticum]|uniref:GNAT family N-acetyltransferase n=1 Tax=Robiginitomaculum antarcticum TaxID=437507 RepID=UPI00037D15A7|nr:GNAT family N-acetyltransferase [Robiginitomaculum antarcticum]
MSHIVLETDRLILRHIDPVADLDAWTDMMSDAQTVRFIGGQIMDRAGAWRQMAMLIGHQAVRGYSFWSVIEKSSGDFIGRVGPWCPEGWPEPEIGWTIHRDYIRKGYAKEAGRACIDYVRDHLGWSRVIHVIGEENIGSIKTAEALGSKRLYPVTHLPPFGEVKCWAYGQEF